MSGFLYGTLAAAAMGLWAMYAVLQLCRGGRMLWWGLVLLLPIAVVCYNGAMPVSYTHLDVYKRQVITEDSIASLKRFKDDAKEVAEGFECGITLTKFSDIKEGDVFECFKMEEYRD